MKRLLALFVCIACLQGTYANPFFVAEVDTVKVDTTHYVSPMDTTVYIPPVDTTYYEPSDTGEVVIPVQPSNPVIYVPVIHEGDNVTEYPHNPAWDKMLSSVAPAKQEFTMTVEGDYLRIKGTLEARGYDKHYIHCQIIGDSVHLQRFDMDPESTDMLLHYVDIRIPGFTEDYYRVTLAEQNDVPLYKQSMVMSRVVKRDVTNIETPSEQSIQMDATGSTLLCTSPNATQLEVYTMDAVKVGEAAFTNGEATVKVNKTPATYLYIVTYPNGQRTSGKVMVK